MPVATGPVRAPHNPHNHVQFIGRALQAQVRNGEVETIAHLDSLRPPQRPSLCGAAAQQRAMRGSLLSLFESYCRLQYGIACAH